MKLKFLSFTMIAAVLTLGWGCSKSDGDDDPGNPQTEPEKEGGIQSQGRTWYPIDFENDWHVNFTPGNETKPDWTSPSAQDYETWMIYQVTIPESFAYWASKDDMLAVFIDGQIRAVASPAYDTVLGDKQTYKKFILKIMGDYEYSQDYAKFTYKYYNAKLKKIFSDEISDKFVPEKVQGVESPFSLYRFYESEPWTVNTSLKVALPDDIRQHIYATDRLAVFVGDECRGITNIDDVSNLIFNVYGNVENETATLYYYRDQLGATRLTPDVKLNGAFMSFMVDGVTFQ